MCTRYLLIGGSNVLHTLRAAFIPGLEIPIYHTKTVTVSLCVRGTRLGGMMHTVFDTDFSTERHFGGHSLIATISL